MSDGSLIAALETLSQQSDKHWVIALSGGLDSSALLHACHRYLSQNPVRQLRAMHIDHQLQDQSCHWAEFCIDSCEALGIECSVYHPLTKPSQKQSLEAWARTERYALLAKHLQSNEILLTAHTLDDQAETFIMQSLRGAGAKGLSSMGRVRVDGTMEIVRPWLSMSRKMLEAYAKQHNLKWVEDPSNQHIHFQRNFIRHHILPKMVELQAGAKNSLAICASIAQENQQLIEELAALDAQTVVGEKGGLSQSAMTKLSSIRQKNLLRYWVAKQNIPLPPRGRLDTILQQMQAKVDANPIIEWADVSFRRYRDYWYVVKLIPDMDYQIPWFGDPQVNLPYGAKVVFEVNDDLISNEILKTGNFSIKPIAGLGKIRSSEHQCSKSLKKWWQQYAVEPWKRKLWPGLFYEDSLILIPGMFTVQQNKCETLKITSDVVFTD